MGKASDRDSLVRLLEPVVAAEGLDLEDVVVTPAGKRRLLRVVVDQDGGVGLDTVAAVSTAVSAALDERDAMGGSPYVLEVTSPGVDRPLTAPRHWRRNLTRLVRSPPPRALARRAGWSTVDDDGIGVESDGVSDRPGLGRSRPAGCRSSSTGRAARLTNDRGGLSHGHRHERAARARAREGDLLPAAGRGHRVGPAHRLPAHRGPPARRRGSSSTARTATSRCGRPRPTTRATSLRECDDTPTGFGRIAATTAKQVILQRLRDAEDEQTFGEFSGKEGDIVSGVVQQGKDPRNVFVDLGRIEAVLPPPEQVPGENYEHGSRLRCYVVQVRKGTRGPSIMLSRTHPNLVRKLFALEVPEIADGTVEIAAIAREAGHRTKIAVKSNRPGVNAKGACIGPMGSRARAVMAELHGEKIDIVDWSEDPAPFLAEALQPARVLKVEIVDLSRPVGPDHRARLPALAGHRQGGAERPARRPADRLADRHPARRRPASRRPPRLRSADAASPVVSPPVRTCVGCRQRAGAADAAAGGRRRRRRRARPGPPAARAWRPPAPRPGLPRPRRAPQGLPAGAAGARPLARRRSATPGSRGDAASPDRARATR